MTFVERRRPKSLRMLSVKKPARLAMDRISPQRASPTASRRVPSRRTNSRRVVTSLLTLGRLVSKTKCVPEREVVLCGWGTHGASIQSEKAPKQASEDTKQSTKN